MTVKELIEDLKKVQNQELDVIVIDADGKILKYDGFGISKVVEVNCYKDESISGVFIVTNK